MQNNSKFRIGVLASTKGTDLQAIIDEINEGKMPGIEIAVVIGNKKNAYALERARLQEVKAIFVDPQDKTREEYDREVSKILDENRVDLLILIGYMRILSPWFVNKYHRKIVNVHNALMPKFSGPGFFGTNVHEQVLKAGESETGCTIHFVEEGVDTGEIIAQKKIEVSPGETVESLKEKVQALEKKLYPEVIRKFAAGEIK